MDVKARKQKLEKHKVIISHHKTTFEQLIRSINNNNTNHITTLKRYIDLDDLYIITISCDGDSYWNTIKTF